MTAQQQTIKNKINAAANGSNLFISYFNGLLLTKRNMGADAVAAKIIGLNTIFNLTNEEMEIVHTSVMASDYDSINAD